MHITPFLHAPVSGVSVLGSILLSFLLSSPQPVGSGRHHHHHHHTHHAHNGAGAGDSFGRYIVFPVGILPQQAADAICVLIILFHARTLERRLGSGRFLGVGLLTNIATAVVNALLLQPGSFFSSSSPASSSSANLHMWLALCAAHATRYFSDVPSLGNTRIFGSLQVSDKFPIYLCLAKLLLFPLRGPEVLPKVLHCVVGAALSSFLLKHASSTAMRSAKHHTGSGEAAANATLGGKMRTLLVDVIPGHIADKIADVLPFFGSRTVIRHAVIQPPQAAHAASGAGGTQQGGGSLPHVHSDDFDDRAGSLLGGATARQRRQVRPQQRQEQQQQQPQAADDSQSVEFIAGCVGCSPEEAKGALEASSGNVDVAISMLLGN